MITGRAGGPNTQMSLEVVFKYVAVQCALQCTEEEGCVGARRGKEVP